MVGVLAAYVRSGTVPETRTLHKALTVLCLAHAPRGPGPLPVGRWGPEAVAAPRRLLRCSEVFTAPTVPSGFLPGVRMSSSPNSTHRNTRPRGAESEEVTFVTFLTLPPSTPHSIPPPPRAARTHVLGAGDDLAADVPFEQFVCEVPLCEWLSQRLRVEAYARSVLLTPDPGRPVGSRCGKVRGWDEGMNGQLTSGAVKTELHSGT